ncbi:MAG: stage V sporulation T C-terminal domain-containing protein [Bacilli bacterium]
MKTTGIVRRIDELGRIVLPKEIRRGLRIRNGESVEICIDQNTISLKKYSPFGVFGELSEEYADSVYEYLKESVLVCDKDKFIAVSGPLKKKYSDKNISEFLSKTIKEGLKKVFNNSEKIELSPNLYEDGKYIITPITTNGEVMGLYIILLKNMDIDKVVESTVAIGKEFLEKHIED